MKRGLITIGENGAVSIPAAPVWMSKEEIADLFGVYGCDIRRAITAIYKDGVLTEQETMLYLRLNNGISVDLFSMEMIIALSYRIGSRYSEVFREHITKCISCNRTELENVVVIINYPQRRKGNSIFN